MSPSAARPYDYLKDMLIQITTGSQTRHIQQRVMAEELGDRTPSQMLLRMKHLLGDTVTDADGLILRQLFLQRLPSQHHSITHGSQLVMNGTRTFEDSQGGV